MTLPIFCFPYAGGSAYAYRPLQAHVDASIELHCMDLPGRGHRVREPLQRCLQSLSEDVFTRIRPRLERGGYALFGHSMGALLAYLCLQRVAAEGLPLPQVLFVSGHGAPSMKKSKGRHRLPKPEFLDMLRELGGCPPEILREPELLDYVEPILRADFEAVETWAYAAAPALPVPIVALHGREDDVGFAQVQAWRTFTSAGFELHEFDGGHFFLLNHWPEIARLIMRRLGQATID